MSYRDKPRLWKTAYYILADDGARAVQVQETVQTWRRGGRHFVEWAIDLRRCCPDHILPKIDEHYLTPSNEYRRIPPHLKPHLRIMWKRIRKRRLDSYGEMVVAKIWEC